MTEPGTLVDLEALVVAHLLDDAAVAAIAGDNVLTELDANFAMPTLQVTRFPGVFTDPDTARLERGRIQVQAWADTKEEAYDLAAAAAVSLKALPDVAHALGVITAAQWEQGPWWNPDPEQDQPRYMMTLAVYAHPA